MPTPRLRLLPVLLVVLLAEGAAFSSLSSTLSRPPARRLPLPPLHAHKPGTPPRRSSPPLSQGHDDPTPRPSRSRSPTEASPFLPLLRLRQATAPLTLSLLSLLGSFSPLPAPASAASTTSTFSTTLLPSPLTAPRGSGQTYSQAMASSDPDHVHEINRRFARHVWSTIGLSFYDKSGGGILGGRGGHDPAWERVWAAAEKRGEGIGGGGAGGGRGFDSVEGTREVIRFMVGELKDEYSAYIAPQEIGGLFRRYPSKAQPRLEQPPSSSSSTSSSSSSSVASTTTTTTTKPSSRNSKDDKADGSTSLSASVGMQLEPAAYCPPATMLQPRYNAATNMYDYPSLPPSSSPSPLFSWLPASLQPSFPPSYSRPCAVVVGVLPNSPAEEAGIRIGDRVSKVGHVMTENTAGWDRDGTLENTLLQGREGTSVQVELLRMVTEGGKEGGWQGREQRVPLTLRRRSFASNKYPALRVQSLLDEEGRRVSYIRLHRFDAPATAQLRSVLYAEEAVGAEAYVIDLRNNMGGIFQESLKMAALFLPDPKAVLCFTMDAFGGFSAHLAEEYDTSATLPLTASGSRTSAAAAAKLLAHGEFSDNWQPLVPANKPVVVLVNKGSASSSETFAAALHDNNRAWLVGERTFGKSLIQHLFPLPDGGALKLTVAEYLTPKQRHLARIRLPGPTRGRSVSATTFNAGLEPDVAVADSAPRPNSMDDVALTQAMELLARQPFPPGGIERRGERGQAGKGGGTGVVLSFFSHSKRK